GGSDGYLVIPALMEVSVMLLLPNRRLLRIEQDGFLRAFDQSTVLWPAAYLLSQWLASPDRCSQLRGRKVLELGAGVGGPAVAAAACGAKVLATDEALRSLALIQANAGLNGEELDTEAFDWHDDAHLDRIRGHGPFDLIIGAALRFEDWWPRLWHVLSELSQGQRAPLIALVHSSDAIQPPAEWFQLVQRISGDAYGMARPDRGPDFAASDFELVLFKLKEVSPSPSEL
ncbi:unnamed protein product, partial [Polarella glacialis]